MDNLLNKTILVRWADSYGVTAGWEDISDYTASELIIESYGRVIFEDDNIISLAHNYSDETEHNPRQANGVMVIPKCCIKFVTSFSSCPQPE